MYNNHMDNHLYTGASTGKLNIVGELGPYDVTPRHNTVLHIAANAGQADCVRAILSSHPWLLLQTNSRGETALHFAARAGHESSVVVLLECAVRQASDESTIVGEMLRMVNVDKETAFHMAVRYHRCESARILLNADQDCEYLANVNGETPLYAAAVRGYGELVELIVDGSRALNYGGPDERTALHAAVFSSSRGMYTYIYYMITTYIYNRKISLFYFYYL